MKISNGLKIVAYLHCSLCLKELDKLEDMSPQEYARYSVGYTKKGLQLWCNRHNCNIIHIDFEGIKHSANTTRKR